MGTVQRDDQTLWVRCWDGTEMEYDAFCVKDIKDMLAKKMTNQDIANQMGAVYDSPLEKQLNKIRKERV